MSSSTLIFSEIPAWRAGFVPHMHLVLGTMTVLRHPYFSSRYHKPAPEHAGSTLYLGGAPRA